MRLRKDALAIIFLLARAAAQQPDPGVWFLSPSPTGASADGRFEVETTPAGAMLLWAPFGKEPVSWGPISLKPDGSIEFHSSGNPPLLCKLVRAGQRNFKGVCQHRGEMEHAATMSRNQPPNGLDLPVSGIDFRVLAKARQLLSGSSVWNRHDQRYCESSANRNSWSLFCALYQASFNVAGQYVHLRPVMEEVRAALGEITHGRHLQHPLMDYNNLESTTYADIEAIFDRAEQRLQTRKACSESRGSKWVVDGPSASRTPEDDTMLQGPDVVFWGEGLSYTATALEKTYRLREMLGPIANHAKVPADWLAASTEVVRKTWRHDRFDGVDVKGTLPDGNHWRYFCLCGESWRYYDVPMEAAVFFDRVIDGAYSHRGHR